MNTQTPSHFFKVMHGDFRQKLKIPTDFVHYIRENSTETAILVSPRESTWKVKVTTSTDGGLCMEDGWGNFARAHSLNLGEFLLFQYNGKMNFSVRIFSVSAVERDNGVQQVTKCEVSKRRGKPKKSVAFKSEFPYCLVEVKPYNLTFPCQLNVPIAFARAYLPCDSTNVTLKTLEGETWSVKYYTTPTAHRFLKGWKEFAFDNNLKGGDICVFELVDAPRGKIQVHFFPKLECTTT
ncbi:hypothetical protein ACHQM5_016362 [Ranunculus cassubicifolius]